MRLIKASVLQRGLQLLAHAPSRHRLTVRIRVVIDEQRVAVRKAAVRVSVAEVGPELRAEIRSHDDRFLFGFALTVQEQQTAFLSVRRQIAERGRGKFRLPSPSANHQRGEEIIPLSDEGRSREVFEHRLQIRAGEQAMP